MSRGVDVTFVDPIFRVWKVSCKCMKLTKKIWNELEQHDIVAVHEDRKPTVFVITEFKLAEMLKTVHEWRVRDDEVSGC